MITHPPADADRVADVDAPGDPVTDRSDTLRAIGG
jgi:hypothetical protein